MDIARFPVLFHLTTKDNAENLLRHGLHCAADLIRRADLPADEKERLLSGHRPTGVVIQVPGIGPVELRDQKPLDTGVLAERLKDVSVGSYIRDINERVFFWPRRRKVVDMLGAYANQDRVVLHIRTSDLFRDYRDRMQGSVCNSGFAKRRVKEKFRREDIFFDLTSPGVRGRRMVEVVVRGSVPNLADYVIEREDIAATPPR